MMYFFATYKEARAKFKQSAHDVGATVQSIGLTSGYEVDVASVGSTDKPTLILSSALHGVEGFAGSAVQLAVLDALQSGFASVELAEQICMVFVHGINPFGFENIRRFDENNIDLNRNFPLHQQQYRGSPEAYQKLNSFLNPQSPPSTIEPYRLRAAFNIMRYGLPALKEAIVCGQYQYPQGIFYGGSEPSIATKFVMTHCKEWVSGAEKVSHIDIHTGLGEFATYKILINEAPSADNRNWYLQTFGEEFVSTMDNTDETAYTVNGAMGTWLQQYFSDRSYYFAGAEFGTYDPVRVLGAIRSENRAHYYASADSKAYRKAKAELLECFCPASEQWRKQVIDSSMQIVTAAIEGLLRADRESKLK